MRATRFGSTVAVSILILVSLGACGGGLFDIPEFDIPDPVIEPGPAKRDAPQVAMATNGKATCVWLGDDHIYAERYIPGTGWTDYRQVDDALDPAGPPEVAMDPNGDAVVVWEQDGRIVANCFEVGDGWRGAETISDPLGAPASRPRLGSADDGGTIVVWEEGGSVVAAVFDPVLGWDLPASVAMPAVPASDVQVSVLPSGDAVAVWDEGDATVVGSTFDDLTQTWSPPVPIGSGDAPQIATDAAGNGVVVFEQAGDVLASEFDAASGFQPPVEVPLPVAVEDLPAAQPDFDLGDGGVGTVVFEVDGEIYAGRYEVGVGFEEAEVIAPGVAAAGDPEVAVDEDGNALAVFEDDAGNVQAVRRREAYDDWLEPSIAGTGRDASVDVNDDGEAISVWIDDDQIDAVRIANLDPTTAVTLTVTVTGQGQVVSDPAGLDCLAAGGSVCEMLVPSTASVLLTAVPSRGNRFVRWIGVGVLSQANPSVEVFVLSDMAVEAVFEPVP